MYIFIERKVYKNNDKTEYKRHEKEKKKKKKKRREIGRC